jgi:general secretion pathway protein G
VRSKAGCFGKTIGLIVVVSIGVLQITLFVGISAAGMGSAKVGAATAEIELFDKFLAKFKNDTGRYPTMEEGLEALRHKPSMISNWNGPYINKEIPLDPWRKAYVYIYPAKYGNKSYDIYSFGANMKDDLGEKDDITNWRKINYEYYDRFYNIKKLLAAFVVIILVVAVLYWLLRNRRLRKNRPKEQDTM